MKSAIVTGASAGIGLAITRTLCQDGFRVTMAARREGRLTTAAEGLRGEGFDVHAVAIDASADGAADQLVGEHIRHSGGVDVVVANAGRGTNGTVADASAADIAKMLAVNVAAPFALAKAAMPALRASAGWFVITSSMSGVWPTTGSAGYSASKAAAVSLARSIASEEAEHGVRSCAICPAFVDTDMTSWLEGSIPPDEMLEANDMAESVRFLLRLSPSASVTELVLRRVGAPDPHSP